MLKAAKKLPKLAKIDPKMSKVEQNQLKDVKKYPKSTGVTLEIKFC